MKFVESGEGKIPLLSVVAILAISLTVNLPGLAISPVLGKLTDVFPHVTKLEVQLLNVLPNLVTIPFILCSGKICNPHNQLKVLTAGLIIYTATGVAYFFAKTMIVLILLSCLLGVGCGLVIPLAASLISQNFTGGPLGTALGAKSGLSNFMVIIATLFVGWVASSNWHLAFTVYFVPLIPLVLVPFMRSSYINQVRGVPQSATTTATASAKPDTSFHFQGKKAIRMMWGAMILYFLITYATMAISYYLPFTMKSYGLDPGKVGVATAMFYLSATMAGFGLSKVIKATGVWTLQIGMILATLGLLAVGFIHAYACYIIGVFIMGIGYGLVQPILYDKTSYFAPTSEKSTEYFAFLLTCNYVGISTVPFIVEFFGSFIKESSNPSFPFVLNGIILALVTVFCFVKHKSFVVQAGVIPEAGDIMELPSSILSPGKHFVHSETDKDDDKNEEVVETTAKPVAEEDNSPESILKAAKESLSSANDSLAQLRHDQAEMLKKEAAALSEKASELNDEASKLLKDASELEEEKE